MRSNNKKVISLVLLIAFLVTSFAPTTVFAETSDTSLQPGRYRVAINKLDSDLIGKKQLVSYASQQPQISEVGILDVAKDGTMSLMYRLYGAYKLENNNPVAYSWSGMQFIDSTATTLYSSADKITMTCADATLTTANVVVPVKDLTVPIGVIEGIPINETTNNGIRYGIQIDNESICSLSELETAVLNNETLQYDITYDVFKKEKRHHYDTVAGVDSLDAYYTSNIYMDMFEPNVKITSKDGAFPITAVYTLQTAKNEEDKIAEFKQFKTNTTELDSLNYLYQATYSENLIRTDSKDVQTVSLQYDTIEDLVFGTDICFHTVKSKTESDSKKANGKDKYNQKNKFYYFGRLHPVLKSSMKCEEDVILKDSATGVQVVSSTKSYAKDSILHVTVNSDKIYYPDLETKDDNDNKSYYDAYVGMAEDGKCITYTLQLTDADGNLYREGDVVNAAKIVLPIPEAWSGKEVSFLVYNNVDGADKGCMENTLNTTARENIYTIDYDNKQIVLDTSKIGSIQADLTYRLLTSGTFILFVEADSINPSTLDDGIYKITARTSKSTNSAQPSMSNAALNHTAYLVKSGEQMDLYLQFKSLTVGDTKAYIGGLNSIAEDDSRFGGTYYDYYTIAEDGSGTSNALLDNAIYDANTEYACVQAMKLNLTGGRWNKKTNGYTVGISAPVMAAINSLPADEVGDLGCTLLLSAPQRLTSATDAAAIANYIPVYEEQPDVLRRAIDAAKTLYKAEDYTADSYAVLTEALELAEAVYIRGETGEAIRTQVAAIDTAIAQLVALSDVDKTDLQAAVDKAKAITNADNTYTALSFKALQAAITAAQAVLDDAYAGQASVDAQLAALNNAIAALVRSTQLANGEFEVGVTLRKAYADEASMGNASLNQYGILHVNEDGSATLTMDFHSMSFSGFTGYLGYLKILNKDGVERNKFGGWDYDDTDVLNVLTVKASYDYMPDDAYTGDASTDPDIGGKQYQYPKTYVLNIDNVNKMMSDNTTRWWEEVYVEVYAPVMASVPGTSGRQEARLLIDFSAYDEAGNKADTTALERAVTQAEAMIAAGKNGADDTSWSALTSALAAAKDLLGRNPTETQITAQTKALQSAMDAVKDAQKVDKSVLESKLKLADTYVDAKYTQASFAALEKAKAYAKAVIDGSDATKADVEQAVKLLESAMAALVAETVSLPKTGLPIGISLDGDFPDSDTEKLDITLNNSGTQSTTYDAESGTHQAEVLFGNTTLQLFSTTSSSVGTTTSTQITITSTQALQYFAYEQDGEWNVTSTSALQWVNGNLRAIIDGLKAPDQNSNSDEDSILTKVRVAFGYLKAQAQKAYRMVRGVSDNPFADYGDDIIAYQGEVEINWNPAYEESYVVSATILQALRDMQAAAETVYADNLAHGYTDTDAGMATLKSAIDAAKDLQSRVEKHLATDTQAQNVTTALERAMQAVQMDTVQDVTFKVDGSVVKNTVDATAGDTVSVFLSTNTVDATLYYTLDGTTPDATSAKYDAKTGIAVSSAEKGTITLNAIAVKTKLYDSAISTLRVAFAEEDKKDNNNTGNNTKDSNYYVPVELQKERQESTSMGDVAFANNRKALAVSNGDGTYDILVATNPVNVSGYRSAITSIDVDGYDVSVKEKAKTETTEKYDGMVHTLNYISLFEIKDVEKGTDYVYVTFDVPYTPMDEAVDGELCARLCFDWSNAKETSATSLHANTSAAKGQTELTSDAVDLTDKATGIRLTAEEDVLPNGTKLTVDTITSGSDYESAVSALDGIAEQFKLYNIVVKASGEEVEPSTTVKLYFPIPSDYDASKVAVYRINEDGTKVVVKGEVKNGYYIIETKTFGVYALALTDQVLNQEKYEASIQKVVDQYPDLQGHWGAAVLAAMANRGLLAGVSDTEMAPDSNLTRGMLVTILHRMAGNPVVTGGMYYDDVADTAWYAQSVRWASENGIANGMGDGIFAPDEAITREQLAVMLVNYARAMDITLPPALGLGFSDAADVSDWATEAVRIMVNAKVIGGYEDGTLRPGATATRAEAAAMIERFLELFVDPMLNADSSEATV